MLSVLRNRFLFVVSRCNVNRTIQKTIAINSITPYITRQATVSYPVQINFQCYRYKSKKKKAKIDEQESETDQDEDKDAESEILDKHTKVMTVSVNSLRLDLLVKSGLGMARNKVETLFYESKIRLNGQKVFKKSENVSEGDEIDVIKGVSAQNPDFLNVARLEIISVAAKTESFSVKLRRFKSLNIENYEDKWKSGS